MVHTLNIATTVAVPLVMDGTVMMVKMSEAGILRILILVSFTQAVMLVFTGMAIFRHGTVRLSGDGTIP